MQDALDFIAAIFEFKFFAGYRENFSDIDWVSLGLGAKIEDFEKFEPICQIWEMALTVYLNVRGNIAVAVDRKSYYDEKFLKANKVDTIKPGTSFGEIGVLYGASR